MFVSLSEKLRLDFQAALALAIMIADPEDRWTIPVRQNVGIIQQLLWP
jgi:hypothetical protein